MRYLLTFLAVIVTMGSAIGADAFPIAVSFRKALTGDGYVVAPEKPSDDLYFSANPPIRPCLNPCDFAVFPKNPANHASRLCSARRPTRPRGSSSMT